MPETQEILEIFATILGSRTLRPADEPWNLKRVPDGTCLTYLCNAEGVKLGAVVTDINATVYLGGKLVMLPEAGMAEKAKRLEIDETLTDAVAEIVNMTRCIFNQKAGNEHLSPLPTEAMKRVKADDENAWLLEPSSRLDLAGECSFGTLRITYLFR